jgi:transposase
VLATIGDVARFRTPGQLVSYLGLDPRVRQSGNQPAHTGPISTQGRAHARGLLTEAAWAAAKYPGPLRAFYERVRSRRGPQIAAVATARKLAVLIWYLLTRDEDFAWAGTSLTATKLRRLELAAGAPSHRGGRRSWAASSATIRAQERAVAAGAEEQYRRFVSAWRVRPAQERDAGAATGERPSGAMAPAARQG